MEYVKVSKRMEPYVTLQSNVNQVNVSISIVVERKYPGTLIQPINKLNNITMLILQLLSQNQILQILMSNLLLSNLSIQAKILLKL